MGQSSLRLRALLFATIVFRHTNTESQSDLLVTQSHRGRKPSPRYTYASEAVKLSQVKALMVADKWVSIRHPAWLWDLAVVDIAPG